MNNSDFLKLKATANDLQFALALIIEQNPSEQGLFSLIQESVGMVPRVVSNTADALEAIKYLRFNLIILNLQMPKFEGVECAKQIRHLEQARGTKTPMVAVTAHPMPCDRDKCLSAGMDDYLAKPFSS